MNNEELIAQARGTTPHIKIAAVLWVLGMMAIMAATITWVIVSVWASDYYGLSKATRDAALVGSAALSDLQNIQATKARVLPLEVLGLATFLLGFGFAFANILKYVRLRGNTMAAVLPALKERKAQGQGLRVDPPRSSRDNKGVTNG
jgi:hypothetical protein